jgi:hypothetical protein
MERGFGPGFDPRRLHHGFMQVRMQECPRTHAAVAAVLMPQRDLSERYSLLMLAGITPLTNSKTMRGHSGG